MAAHSILFEAREFGHINYITYTFWLSDTCSEGKDYKDGMKISIANNQITKATRRLSKEAR